MSSVLLAAACQLDSFTEVRTQLVVDVDAQPLIRMRATQIEVSVVASADDAGAVSTEPVTQNFVIGAGNEPLTWPVRIVLAPNGTSMRLPFSMTATALDDKGAYVAELRLISTYIANEIRHAQFMLDDLCLLVRCDDGETCGLGACRPCMRDATSFPLFWPQADSGISTPIVDASTRTDAGPRLDAGTDAALVPIEASAPIDPCETNNGGCDPLVTCTNLDGEAICGSCPPGFSDPSGKGKSCVDIDECKTNNGGCDVAHGSCTNTPGGRDCRCNMGYHGDGSHCALNVPCTDASVCDATASCVTLADQHVCVCDMGFEGDGAHCTDVDECARKTAMCGANRMCFNSEGMYSCPCADGFEEVGESCVDIDECKMNTDSCSTMPEACVNKAGGFSCKCPAGFTGTGEGPQGCADIDECATNNGGCDITRACVNLDGAHACGACQTGYMASGTMKCVDINECLTANGGCDTHRACMNTAGSFTCGPCQDGFVDSGALACTDLDECKTNNGGCDPKRACVNGAGGRTCGACDPGYTPSGATGCMDVNECLTNNGTCDSHRTCINGEGTSSCGACAQYWAINGDKGCVDVKECSTNNGGCGSNRTCTENIGAPPTCVDPCSLTNGGCDTHRQCSYTLTGGVHCGDCSAGYLNDGALKCKVDPCYNVNCGTGGSCSNGTCICGEGYKKQGQTCVPDPCYNKDCGLGVCNANGNCVCSQGQTQLPDGRCIANPCANNGPCAAQRMCTVNGSGQAQCADCTGGLINDGATGCKSCPSGYEIDTPSSCKDIDECANGGSNSCNPHRQCMNIAGSYFCGPCEEGWEAVGDYDCVPIIIVIDPPIPP